MADNESKFKDKDFRALAALDKKDKEGKEVPKFAEEIQFAEGLSKEECLEYSKRIMQAAVDNEKDKKDPNVQNIFRGRGAGVFYVAVTQVLLKKYGFPSSEFIANVTGQMNAISTDYKEFKDSGKANEQAEKSAKGMKFNDENDKATYIMGQEKAILERKLHELSVKMKADIVLEFQSKIEPILSVFEPVRAAVPVEKQQDYMMAIFAGYCSLSLGQNAEIQKSDTNKVFSQLFSVIDEKNAAASENIKLLQPLKESVNTPEVERKAMSSTPLELLTNPVYFDTPSYNRIKEYLSNPEGPQIGEIVDFIRAVKNFEKSNESNREAALEVLKEMLNREYDENLVTEAPVPLNLADGNKKALVNLMNVTPLDFEGFKKKLNETIKADMMPGFKEQLGKIPAEVLSPPKPKVESVSSVQTQPQPPKPTALQRVTSAVITFFQNIAKTVTEAFAAKPINQQPPQKPKEKAITVPPINFADIKQKLQEQKNNFPKEEGQELTKAPRINNPCNFSKPCYHTYHEEHGRYKNFQEKI